MSCSKCGAEDPVRAKFCVECASALARRCAWCNAENPPTAKFCLECAKPLDDPVLFGRIGSDEVLAQPVVGLLERQAARILRDRSLALQFRWTRSVSFVPGIINMMPTCGLLRILR